MRRLLVFVIVLYLVWRVLGIVGRRLRRSSRGADEFSRYGRNRRRAGTGADRPEELVACAACGTLVPASHAVAGPGSRVFCSSECRDGGRREDHGDRAGGAGPAA